MLADEFVRQQINAGYKVHHNQGIWWQQVAPFVCKPVVRLIDIKPLQSRPKLTKSFLGYSHVSGTNGASTRTWPVMMLREASLKHFSILALSSSKRARVRKGLRLNEVKRIEKIEPVLNRMNEICISAAKRTQHGKSAAYYTDHYHEWEDWIIREFNLSNREWWGTFHKEILIAYIYGTLIDDTMFIYASKSHSDSLNKCPNDALLFSFLDHCRTLDGCRQVIFGDWSKDRHSLNSFKMGYGFEREDLPVYVRFGTFRDIARRFMKITSGIPRNGNSKA